MMTNMNSNNTTQLHKLKTSPTKANTNHQRKMTFPTKTETMAPPRQATSSKINTPQQSKMPIKNHNKKQHTPLKTTQHYRTMTPTILQICSTTSRTANLRNNRANRLPNLLKQIQLRITTKIITLTRTKKTSILGITKRKSKRQANQVRALSTVNPARRQRIPPQTPRKPLPALPQTPPNPPNTPTMMTKTTWTVCKWKRKMCRSLPRATSPFLRASPLPPRRTQGSTLSWTMMTI